MSAIKDKRTGRVYRKGSKMYNRYAKRLRRRRGFKPAHNVPEWASLSETKDFGALNVGTSYNINDVQLSAFPRASAVAQGYQFFRIKLLKFIITPLLDTFSSAGATQVPYFHWVINKTGSGYVGLNKDWYLQNGAKPRRFDDKNVVIQYAPPYRDWETDRKSTRLNSSHSAKSRMPSSA